MNVNPDMDKIEKFKNSTEAVLCKGGVVDVIRLLIIGTGQ